MAELNGTVEKDADVERMKEDCCCPKLILYFISTNCVTVNNGSCEDWDFCQPQPLQAAIDGDT